jgi:hypothetical protein
VNPIDDTVELPEPRWDERQKKWVVPKNVRDDNALSRRRFLFEIDGISLEGQRALLEPLLKTRIIQRVVFSGHKSLHCVIEEADEPEDNEMYKWVWRFLALKYFKDTRFHDLSLPLKKDGNGVEIVDSSCGHPSRTTRTPFAARKDKTTGWEPVEQTLLYFEEGRTCSGWRPLWTRAKARYDAELERTRKRAWREAWKYRDREKKTPNAAARRFMGGDMSDGWKHAELPGAVASLVARGYGREETAAIFDRYRTNQDGKKSDIPVYAMRCYDYFSARDAVKAVDYFTRKNGSMTGGAAGVGVSLAKEAMR